MKLKRLYGYLSSQQSYVYLSNVVDSSRLDYPKGKKLILVDAQCFQSGSFNRGIGRYSRMLIVSLAKIHRNKVFLLYFNNLDLENQLDSIKSVFPKNVENIYFYQSKVAANRQNVQINEISELMNMEIMKISPDYFIGLSIMEHPYHIIPLNPKLSPRSVSILYDVIPLQFPDIFLSSPSTRGLYSENLSRLMSYDVIASISLQSIKNLKHFFPDLTNVYPIFGAGFEEETNFDQISFGEKKDLIAIGSDSPHKNIENVLKAYSKLPIEVRNNHSLHILGISSLGEKARLKQLSESNNCKVTIHGFLSDSELSNLYKTSRVVVVASWEEGLGMPVFEGWNWGSVCIGSQDTAVAEVLGTPEVCFNPHDANSIATTMLRYLEDKDAWEQERRRISTHTKSYNWKRSAELLTQALDLEV
jgi:glycosyltransferase involved in cell wall biosynthesis